MSPASDHILHRLSDEASLWVIPLDGDESGLQGLLTRIQQFIEQWVSHGRTVQGAAVLEANRFLLVAGEVSGGTISGCGIDALMHAIKEASTVEHCRLLSSMLIYYRSESGQVNFVSRGNFRKMVSEGLINSTTKVFNPGIYTVGALRAKEFELPLADSVYSRMYRTPVAAT
ncbi:MAG: hypothetical protein F4183_01240 [Rhodothermaceae bacterium]|nr:hypothetical protein [Rhodothermaceae bacterium]MYF63104.1 hypothetical protein [Rhodothermaceae bacterium]